MQAHVAKHAESMGATHPFSAHTTAFKLTFLHKCAAVHAVALLSLCCVLFITHDRMHLPVRRAMLAHSAGGSMLPVQVDWKYPIGPSDERTAAVYSPYHITFGGGERYLLYTVAVLQQLGYRTDVIVSPGNSCTSAKQLLSIASGLRVPLANDTKLHVIPKDRYRLRSSKRYVS